MNEGGFQTETPLCDYLCMKERVHMSKKHWHVRLLAVLLAIFLAVPNVSCLTAYAVGETGSGVVAGEIAGINPGEEAPAQEVGETPVEIPAAMLLAEEAGEEESSEEEPADVEDSVIGELKLVYGDEALADEDALVLLVMGDGFTAEEQDYFYESAAETAEYVMGCSPFDEFTDVFKIYALGVVSNESGAQGEDAETQEEAEADVRDTYFGSSFWSYGTQRLLCLSEEGEAKGYALREEYLPLADFNVVIVNSATYGGSGGETCVASLNSESLEIMLHELGHTIADLADEYYAGGYEAEYANLTQESDPEKVSWARFIGMDGVGVYDWGGISGLGWYVPADDCKMQFLGEDYPFCEVCKEELRKAFCADSDVTKLFFQPYGDEFLAGEAVDMSQYFILRRGTSEITGDQLGDALTLTYYDADGNVVEGIPSQAGDYTVTAEFAGDDTYASCSVTGAYTIAPITIDLTVASKVQDGKPAQLKLDVEYSEGLSAEDYYVDIYYYGYQYYSYSVCAEYQYCMDGEGGYDVYYSLTDYSDSAYDEETGAYTCLEYDEYKAAGGPTDPASYTVYVTVYDMDYNVVAEKTMDYKISFASTKVVDNNDPDPYYGYYGANDYGNNRSVLIFGEGFTAEEQGKFDELAAQLSETILSVEPFKETQLYFNFTSVNTISRESGVGAEAQDTVFRLACDEDGLLTEDSCYYGTSVATNLAYYSVNPYYAACIVIVNDEDLAESTAYAPYWYDYTYHYYQTIYITPDEDGMEFAASELLNHLNWEEPGYRAESEEDQALQRDYLIYALHSTYAPVITSRAYDEEMTANGQPVDLTSTFHVYYDGVELPDVKLDLTYYDAQGKELTSAPSKPGEYTVKAETVPYDPENPYEDYWQWYQLVGTEHEDWYTELDGAYDGGLWIGLSRGCSTFTIAEHENLYADLSERTEKNGWYFDAVYAVRDMDLMVGVGSNRFEPERDMTRAEAAVIAVKLAGIDVSEYAGKTTVFTDVPADFWGLDYIVAAYENGIVQGRGNNIFDPNGKVTREEFTTMLVNAVGIDAEEYAGKTTVFTDVPADSWAAKYIAAAYENELVVGRGNGIFGYHDNILRAEVAVMLNNAETKL